jgi:uncharacterized membrane-anchored protein
MRLDARETLTKVPAVTLGFWIIKILATTLGETGGDSVSMSWFGETTPEAGQGGLNGYLVGTAIFGVLLIMLVWAQIRARTFHPWLYWATIVTSTTAGTTLADFTTRSIGIGYPGGSLLLFACVLLSLFAWYKATGTISVNSIVSPREELFYWITITFSQTLGTALGDWIADSSLGYGGGALFFGALLLMLAALYPATSLSRVLPPARRDCRRLSRQAHRERRAGVQPPPCFAGARDSHRRTDPADPAACRVPSRGRGCYETVTTVIIVQCTKIR